MISFTGDLWPSLGSIALTLGIILVIIGLVVWRGRRRGSSTIALDAALAASGWWVLLALLGAVITVLKIFVTDWAELSGSTSIWLSWPDGLPCSELGAAQMLTCSDYMLSDFTVGGASLELRLLAGAALLCSQVITTIPAAILAVICFQTLRGRPFAQTAPRTLVFGAIAVFVFGIASEVLSSVAATAGLREVFATDSDWYPSTFQLTVSPLPFVGALGLAALSAVFRQGLRLQHENEKLQKDAEGLV